MVNLKIYNNMSSSLQPKVQEADSKMKMNKQGDDTACRFRIRMGIFRAFSGFHGAMVIWTKTLGRAQKGDVRKIGMEILWPYIFSIFEMEK